MRRVELKGKAPKKWDVCAPHSQGSTQRTNDFFIADFSFRLATDYAENQGLLIV